MKIIDEYRPDVESPVELPELPRGWQWGRLAAHGSKGPDGHVRHKVVWAPVRVGDAAADARPGNRHQSRMESYTLFPETVAVAARRRLVRRLFNHFADQPIGEGQGLECEVGQYRDDESGRHVYWAAGETVDLTPSPYHAAI